MSEGAHLGLTLNAKWLGDERIPGVLKGAQRVSNDLCPPSYRLYAWLSKLMKRAEHRVLMLKTRRNAARGTSLLHLLQSLLEMLPVVQGVKALLSGAPICRLLLLLHILPDRIWMSIIEAGAPASLGVCIRMLQHGRVVRIGYLARLDLRLTNDVQEQELAFLKDLPGIVRVARGHPQAQPQAYEAAHLFFKGVVRGLHLMQGVPIAWGLVVHVPELQMVLFDIVHQMRSERVCRGGSGQRALCCLDARAPEHQVFRRVKERGHGLGGSRDIWRLLK